MFVAPASQWIQLRETETKNKKAFNLQIKTVSLYVFPKEGLANVLEPSIHPLLGKLLSARKVVEEMIEKS